jgi:TetR/AcrR family fatty acid metabolism transcriptional regulator
MDVSEPPLTARARSRQDTRKRLFQSARTLFSARGLHEVTTHDIARRAGVASGTFYLHFKDKESLFREIVYEAIDGMRQRLRAARQSAPDARAGVRAHAEALVSFAEENRDLVRIVFGRAHGVARLESDVLDYLATSATEIFRERKAAGAVDAALDAQVTAQALTGMFARVVVWWIENPDQISRESVVETLVHIQLDGIYAPGAQERFSGDTMHRKGSSASSRVRERS